jgi:copper chaperone
MDIQVENIKCGGCANHIKQKLSALSEVFSVDVDVEKGVVVIETTDQEAVIQSLIKMGYPPVGSQTGLEALGSKAKSFASCALGSLSKE